MPITYTPLTNFAAKDQMPAGDPGKIIRGVDFSAEFDEIARLLLGAISLAGTTPTLTVDNLVVNMSATLPTPPDATNKALGVNIQYLEQTIGNASIDVTTGPADAAKLVKTDANGVIDLSFLPQSSMVVHGVVDVTAPMTITPTWGDTYFVSTTGTPDGSWVGMGSSASTGDQITFGADNKWHVVPNVNDLTAYVKIIGSTMTGPLVLNAAPAADMIAANKKYVDDADKLRYLMTDHIDAFAAGTAGQAKPINTAANGKISPTLLPVDSMTIHGSTDVTVAMTIAPVHGDGWFASKAGTIHSSWTGVAGNHAEAGDLFLYGTDDKWHEIANETDLNAYLPLVGGTMAASAHISAAAVPTADAHLANKKYVDDNGIGAAIDVSVGGADAGKLIKLDASGHLDITMLPVSAIRQKGGMDPAVAPPAGPTDGDMYFLNRDGLFNAGYPFAPKEGQSGDVVIYANGKWNHIPASTDMSGYVAKTGSLMTGALTLSGAPTAANHAATKKYVDDADALKADKTYVDTQDALSYLKTDHINTFKAGSAGQAKPIVTAADGKIAPQLLPVDSMVIHGSVNPTVAPPTAVHGDAYFSDRAATAGAGWTGIAGMALKSGDLMLFGTDNKWHAIPNETDLNAYLPLVGGTMTGTAHITAAAAPTAVGHLTNKQYVDAQVATRLTQAQADARYAAIADKYPGNAAINTLINAQSYTKAQTDAKYEVKGGGTAGLTQAQVDARVTAVGNPIYATKAAYVAKAGDTMTGALNIVPAAGTAATTALNVTGKIVASGDIWGLSDDRLKDDKESIIDAAESIAGLDTFSYSWSEEAVEAGLADPNDERRMLGVSAQEVARVFPECVSEGDHGYLTVSYDKLAVVALRGIQELLGRVEYLEAQLHDD